MVIYFSVNFDIHEIIEFYHEFWGLWDALRTFNNDGNMGTGTVPRFRHYYTTWFTSVVVGLWTNAWP